MKLQLRLFVFIVGIVAVLLAAVVMFISINARNLSMESARVLAEAESRQYAAAIENVLEVRMQSARTLADSIGALKMGGYTDRELVKEILKNSLEYNPDFFGIWTCWEPNAFDGQDERYRFFPGHDGSGRFIPYFYRSNGTIQLASLEYYDQEGDGDYYLLPLRTGREALLEPFSYTVGDESIWMTTLAVPIFHSDRTVGVVGIDLPITVLQEITEQAQLYETGFGRILSYEGLVVTHPNTDRVGAVAGELTIDDEEARDAWGALRDGQLLSQTSYSAALNEYTYKTLAPIVVGQTGTPWAFGTVIREGEIYAGVNRMIAMAAIAGIIGLLLIAVAVFAVTRPIVNNITHISRHLEGLSSGDFTRDVGEKYLAFKDEVGEMARAVVTMQNSIREILGQVFSSTGKVSSSSETLAASSQEMNASLEEVAASAGEFAHDAQDLNSSAQEMEKDGRNITLQARQGDDAVIGVVEKMKGISENVLSLKDVMLALDSRAQDIGRIMESIRTIADQTNLLALNAAIEAARAGEQGRGFSVVAEEVRKLAEQSAKSAEEITELISATQQEANNAVKQVDRETEAVQEGTSAVISTGDLIRSIVDELNNITEHINVVAGSAEKIGSGSEEVSAAVEEQTATMGEITNIAMELQEMVGELNEALGRFKY